MLIAFSVINGIIVSILIYTLGKIIAASMKLLPCIIGGIIYFALSCFASVLDFGLGLVIMAAPILLAIILPGILKLLDR